jgi:nucleotide-binding universal stress UspA family protein
MKRIVAPVDFSETSENAAIFAGSLAAFYGAELWLYHCYEINIPASGFDYPFVNIGEMQEAADYEMEAFKIKVQSALRITINIRTKTENGPLTDGLVSLCDEILPDMVVMGLSGKNPLTKLIVGSNTIRTLQHLKYPVLVVPRRATFVPVRKIGFACDYEKVIETTPIEPLKKIIRDFNADLYVLNIIYNESDSSPEKIVESLYISILLKEFNPVYQTILSDDVTEGINWFAEKQQLDWIVVIPKKHNLVEKMFSRSTTKNLLYHSNTPVLCMHE